MHQDLSLIFSLGCCALSNFFLSNPVIAQEITQEITTDGSTSTTVNSDGSGNFTIEQGDRAGNNLFHSFGDFSVPTNGSAFFNNATDISNILSRVTGGNISNIDGLIRANGTANLFLINPAGIVFGRNAQLDIGGSFLGTTADSILFEDGEFSATDFDNAPLLTINAPIGLNFRDNPGEIINTSVGQNPNGETNVTGGSVGLQVPDGRSLALVGGDVLLDDGNLTAKGGQIEIGSVLNEGQVGISKTARGFVLDYDSINSFGKITLENTAVVDVTASGGGNINLNADNIVVDNSTLSAGIFPESGFVEAQAGDIELNANDSIAVAQNSRINNNVGDSNNTAIGNSGDIFIEAQNLIVTDGSQVSVSTFGEGNAGDLNIKASDSVVLSGEANFPGGLFAQVDINGLGNGGNLNIETQRLSVSDGSKVQVSTFGLGNAGNLNIKASDVEVFETSQEIFFSTGVFAETSVARMEDDPNVQGVGTGQAGNLLIETESLSITTGGQISASTFGDGDAGNLVIRASDSVEVLGKDLNSNSVSVLRSDVIRSDDVVAQGTGGDLIIETGFLNVSDGGRVSASTFAIGDAGNLKIEAIDSIKLSGEGSGIFTEATSEAEGRGGNINIQTGSLSLNDNAQISAATPLGLGGNITLKVDDNLTLRDNVFISAQAFNNADGGNVNINTNFILAFPNQIAGNGSDIIASAVDGNGGNINITAESLLGIEERTATLGNGTNDIDASSEFGLDGTVSIFTPDITTIQRVTELPNNIVEPEQTVAQACSNNRDTSVASNFVIKGKGGIPPLITAPMGSEMITINGEIAANSTEGYAIPTSIGDIIPARGVIKTPDGRIILTATPVSGSASRMAHGSLNCR